MKNIALLALAFLVSCISPENADPPSKEWLNIYSQQTERTDPGKYASMFKDLPEDYELLCKRIKKQLIHPVEARERGMDMEKLMGDGKFHTVESMLTALDSIDGQGLHSGREVEDRLVVACYHHAMLLTSILRYRGVPCRMRAGFSRFFEKYMDIRFGHIIVEAWDQEKNRWIMLDPDRVLVNMDTEDFEFPTSAWKTMKRDKESTKRYTSSIGKGIKASINLIVLDASLITGEEKLYYQPPEFLLKDIRSLSDLSTHEINSINKLGTLIQTPDTVLNQLKEYYSSNPLFTKTDLTFDEYYTETRDLKLEGEK